MDERDAATHHLATTPPASGVAVSLLDATGALGGADERWVVERLLAALAHLAAVAGPYVRTCLRGGDVRIRVVGDDEMERAHRQYSNVPGTTDVLTFDLREAKAGPLDTDLLVCLDEAGRAAAGRGHPVRNEVLLYALHGVLHCVGEDDHDDAACAQMHAREDGLLSAIGVGAVYAPKADRMSAPLKTSAPLNTSAPRNEVAHG